MTGRSQPGWGRTSSRLALLEAMVGILRPILAPG